MINRSTILVTGSNGQLGSELKILSENSNDTYIFTDVDELDITDASSVESFFETNHIDYCINCAAYTAVDKAESDQETAEKINVKAVEILAKACNTYNAILMHISTDFIFDGKSYLPVSEDAKAAPLSIYGKTKLEGENVALKNCDNTLIIRTSWLYSSFGNNFVKTMLRLAEERDTLGVIFDQVGTPTYARDLAQSLVKIIKSINSMDEKQSKPFGIYHFSNEGIASWYDFAYMIFKLSKKKMTLNPIKTFEYPTPATRPSYSVMDKSKIKKTFSLKIPHWIDSLEDCLKALNK